jgi:aquaglyceroporin related protein
MIPTRDELVEAALNPELPAENSHKAGADVDPNELEAGRMDASLDPTKVAAQVKDARKQRENNFLNYVKTGVRSKTIASKVARTSSRISRSSSRRERWAEQVREEERQAHAQAQAHLPTTYEEEEPESEEDDDGHRQNKARPSDGLPQYSATTAQNGHHDHASITTIDPEEGDYEEDQKFPEEVEPLLEELMEDEVFNNHTSWSVWRTEYREGLAEMLGVIVQLTLGCSANLSVLAAGKGNPNTLNWAWGFATMIAIYVSGGISGAHLNPTLTVTLWFYRGFPKRKMPEFFAGQFLGAFIAPFIAYGVYYAAIHNYIAANGEVGIVGSFVTNPGHDYIGQATAFFNEFVGTVFLVITIMALGDDQNAPPGAGMNSFIVGLVITTLTFAFSFNTGMALNPVRDFGPRLALLCLGYGGDLFTDPYWFYGPFAASLCGAFVGAGIYDFMIFTGGGKCRSSSLGYFPCMLLTYMCRIAHQLSMGSHQTCCDQEQEQVGYKATFEEGERELLENSLLHILMGVKCILSPIYSPCSRARLFSFTLT